MKIQCCVCKKVREDGEFVNKKLDHNVTISHTYCPICAGEAIKELDHLIKPKSRVVI